MNWFRHIIRSGLSSHFQYQEKRGILLANYICLVLLASMVLLFVIRRTVFGDIPGGITPQLLVIGTICFLSPIAFNRLGLTTVGRILVCHAPVWYVWYAYISLMKDMNMVDQVDYDSLRIHLLSVSFIPYLLLDRKKPVLLALGVLPTLISLTFFEQILSAFSVGLYQKGMPVLDSPVIGIRVLVAYCVINVSCFIFQSIISYNDTLNKRILDELAQKNEEIKAQNDELLTSQNSLHDVNQHLEELVTKKTENVKKQNETILKYAYMNAHHVRGSVARLLGLIQVSRLKTDLDYPWFFNKVEDEAKKADEIIIRIGKELDQMEQDEVKP